MESREYIEINYSLFRDYRIVKMADAQGNVRNGIFIPFLQNGILWDGSRYKHPYQFLKPIRIPLNGIKSHKLIPMVSIPFKEKMIKEGVLCREDKYPCSAVGYICKDKKFI